MQYLDSIKAKHSWVSYADLYTFAGVVVIEAMGGPKVRWAPGRSDATEMEVQKAPVHHGRLPDAAQGAKHVREVFYRMGFDDAQIVALCGAHSLGRCHKDRSGFDGPWTYTPTRFTNQFFKLLKNETWTERKWDGPKQYQNPDGDLMMLPSDIALFAGISTCNCNCHSTTAFGCSSFAFPHSTTATATACHFCRFYGS